MRKLNVFASAILVAILVTSCGVAGNGFGGSSIQKRKYTKGFYHNKNRGFKSSNETVQNNESIESNDVLVEETEVRSLTKNKIAESTFQTDKTIVKSSEQTQPQQNSEEKTSSKKKTVTQKKDSKPTPTRQRKQREHEYYVPVKEKKAVVSKQKSNSGNADDSMFILAVILAILIPPVGVAVYTNIDWKKVLICLLLTILFFLPGMIYALLVVFDVI